MLSEVKSIPFKFFLQCRILFASFRFEKITLFPSHFYKLGSKSFWLLVFNPFTTLVQNFKFVPSANPKLLNLKQNHPSKKLFFWSNPYKIEVMTTSTIEMLELPNFGHMTTSTM